MLAKLNNPKLLSEVISIISELVTEVKIRFDETGLSIIAVDPANVAMVSFKLPKEAFSEYESGKEVLGINLDSLKAVLRRTKSGSSLIIQNEEGVLKLNILDKIKRSFAIALIEIESEDKKIPSLEFMSQIHINPPDFCDTIDDCLVVSDSCVFIAQPDKFTVEASGLNSAKAEFSGDEVKIISGNSKARYSLEYLQKFMKASKLANQIRINFSSDHPLKLEFKHDKLDLYFILAPRVENED